MIPPGPKGEFLIGHIRQFRNDPLDFLLSNMLTYGDVAHLRFGPRRVYQLNNPDDIQYVLVKAADKFYKSPMLKRATRKAIGEGLLTSEGDFHKRQRKMVQPAFHHNRIANYADVMVDYTAQMLDRWESGQQQDMHHEMMRLTMQIVAKTLFDTDVASDMDAIGQAISIGIEAASERITKPLSLPEWIPTQRNIERRKAAEVVAKTVLNMIDARRESGEDRGDLLSMLLMGQDENGEGMTDKQVYDEVVTLFIAGHETTANALAWTLYLLAQHPEVEAKLVDELQTVLGGRTPTMADLGQLRYTDKIFKESMRLYPPAWVITRQAIENVTIGGYEIPAGSVVLMSPYVIHRHPDYWDEPKKFMPERFAPGWEDRTPKYAYFPFGGGPRICVGNQFAMMEANLVLATIMQRCSVSLAPGQQVEIEPLVTLRPKHGIPMTVKMRENSRLMPA
jgi:cytochrome P450